MLDAKLLKPRPLMETETAYRPVNYRDFRETGPQGRIIRKVDNAIHCINLYQMESGFIKPGEKYKGFTSRPVFT